MKTSRPRVYVYSGRLPWWLGLAAVPLGLVFLSSLLLAAGILVIGGAIAALVLPRVLSGSARRGTDDAIELDPSEYRRVEHRGPGNDHQR